MTFHRVEHGENIRLSTNKAITTLMGDTRSEPLQVISGYAEVELGEDAKYLVIEPRNHDSKLHDAAEGQCA